MTRRSLRSDDVLDSISPLLPRPDTPEEDE